MVRTSHTNPFESGEYLKKEIDDLINSSSGGYIMEYYQPPWVATDYLVGMWGFDKPVIREVSLTRQRIIFEYPSKLRMKIFLHIQWDNLRKNRYRIVKEYPVDGSIRS